MGTDAVPTEQLNEDHAKRDAYLAMHYPKMVSLSPKLDGACMHVGMAVNDVIKLGAPPPTSRSDLPAMRRVFERMELKLAAGARPNATPAEIDEASVIKIGLLAARDETPGMPDVVPEGDYGGVIAQLRVRGTMGTEIVLREYQLLKGRMVVLHQLANGSITPAASFPSDGMGDIDAYAIAFLWPCGSGTQHYEIVVDKALLTPTPAEKAPKPAEVTPVSPEEKMDSQSDDPMRGIPFGDTGSTVETEPAPTSRRSRCLRRPTSRPRHPSRSP